MCHKPGDPDFQELSIDRSIIRRCKEGAAAIQAQSRESSMVGSPKTPSPYAELPIWPPNKGLRATDVESGYGTDTDRSDMNPSCPGSPTGTGWTPVNKRKVLNLNNFQFPPPAREITSTPWVKASATSSSRASSSKRTYFNEEASDENTLMSTQPLETSQASPKRRKVTPDPTSNKTPEVEAAYTLVQLSLADAKLSVEKKGARRRRASA